MSDTTTEFPKGLRRISAIRFHIDRERGIAHLSVQRINRRTGLPEDSDGFGTMTLADLEETKRNLCLSVDALQPGATLYQVVVAQEAFYGRNRYEKS